MNICDMPYCTRVAMPHSERCVDCHESTSAWAFSYLDAADARTATFRLLNGASLYPFPVPLIKRTPLGVFCEVRD